MSSLIPEEFRPRLIAVFQELSELTKPECARCNLPHGCCAREHCESTREFARDHWGVELAATGHPKLPLMGPQGCTVAPHLRPICTLHTCEVQSFGGKRGDQAWTEKYFTLREETDDLFWRAGA